MSRGATCGLVLALLAGASSCSEFQTAVVEGTVTCNGQPVPAGMVTFFPDADTRTPRYGWNGRAYLDEDGTYRVRIFAGRWRVAFEPPNIAELEEEAAGTGEEAEEAREELGPAREAVALPCQMPLHREVQIVKGRNTLDIELPPLATRE